MPGHRRRPDGVDLTWRQIGVLDMLDDPALPFFTQWEIDPGLHPSGRPRGADRHRGTPRSAATAATIAAWLDEPLERADFRFDWIEDEDPGLVAVHFATPHGIVRID